MKKQMIVGIAMAMGVLSVGAMSASASIAGSCCNSGTCADKQAVQKFTQETDALSSALKVKNAELRQQYSYDGIDAQKVSALEAEISELKNSLKAAAGKYGISTCCLS